MHNLMHHQIDAMGCVALANKLTGKRALGNPAKIAGNRPLSGAVPKLAPNVSDLTGHRFGRYTVVDYAPHRGVNRHARWKVRCDCGTEKEVAGQSLVSGKSKSCGCIMREKWEEARRRRAIIEQALAAARTPGQ
jgi:hypothetical protein